ncbi:MAG: hypothetical protein IPJ01_10820 [Micavibrio sp.]|nr:hypothetical protein [Micavibrio sp.]
MDFIIQNKTEIGSIVLYSGDVINYDGESHYFNIILNSHKDKMNFPYIFGVVNGMVDNKNLHKAIKECKEFLIKMNWL